MLRRLIADPSVRWSVTLFLVTRITLSLLGIVLWQLNLAPKSAEAFSWPLYEVTPPVVTGLSGMLLGVWQRYDVVYYIVIATVGYFTSQLTVFPPGFPLAMRIMAYLTGGNMLLAGFMVANLACLFMLIVFYRLILAEGLGDDDARRATLYLLFYPTAIYLLVPYAESVFMLFTLITFLQARRGRWGWAALAGFLAAFTRLQGICLCLVIGWEMLEQTGWKPWRLGWRMLLAALPAVAVGLFFGWREWGGHPSFAALHAQFWGQFPAQPLDPVLGTLQRIVSGRAYFMEYVNLFFTLVTFALGILVTRRLPISYSLYFWVAFVFTLMRSVADHPLADQSRYTLTLFPALMVLAQQTKRPWLHRLVLYPSAIVWLVLSGVYVMGGFVG